jgi:hypothetical protein
VNFRSPKRGENKIKELPPDEKREQSFTEVERETPKGEEDLSRKKAKL